MEAHYKPKGGITVKDVPADKFIATLAMHFKNANVIEVPAWADYAKTACFKEHTPLDPDWFYIRAGMYLFNIYISSSINGLSPQHSFVILHQYSFNRPQNLHSPGTWCRNHEGYVR